MHDDFTFRCSRSGVLSDRGLWLHAGQEGVVLQAAGVDEAQLDERGEISP
jgi:hypothetical protein